MSILITGMKMPTSCLHGECPIAGEYCVLWEEKHWKSPDEPYRKRHPRCPLVPVPPHGRLIDADALDINRREEQAWHDYEQNPDNEYLEGVKDGLHEAAKQLSIAPTIIPEEPCNDLAKPNDTIFAVQNTDEDEWLFAAKPIDYMHHPSVEEIIEGNGFDSFIKHFED